MLIKFIFLDYDVIVRSWIPVLIEQNVNSQPANGEKKSDSHVRVYKTCAVTCEAYTYLRLKEVPVKGQEG